MTHDSAAYIFAAVSLLEGKGLEYFGYPSPFIQWPPLYPAILAAARLAGIYQLAAAGALNAAAQSLIVILSGYWFYSSLKFKQSAVLGTLLITFALPLIWVSKYVWTETLYILLFILFYICFEKFIKHGKSAYLTAAGVFSALAFLDRYAGITIVFTATVFLGFQKKAFAQRITNILKYGFISCLPLAIWVIRNYIVSSTLMGVRLPSPYSLKLNVERTITALRTWIAPEPMLGHIIPEGIIPYFKAVTVLVPVTLTCIFAITLIHVFLQRIFIRFKQLSEGGNAGIAISFDYVYPAIFMSVYTAVYMIYLLASATKILFEPINSRYLVPVYIPLVVIFVVSLDILAGKLKHVPAPVLKACLVLISGLLAVYPVLNTLAAVSGYADKGAGGYSDRKYYNNKLVEYVSENPAAMTYYSNSAELVALLSGVRTYYLPKREGPYMYGAEQFKKAVDRDKASAIVWINGNVQPNIYSLDEIKRMYRLEVIKEFEEGTVYRILKQEVLANE